MALAQVFGQTAGAYSARIMKAATSHTQNVETDVSGALPTVANLPNKIAELLNAIPSPYLTGCTWQMHRAVKTLWDSQWSTAGRGIDPESMRGTLFTYPFYRNDHLDDGGTAADVSLWFGDMMAGMTIGRHKFFEVRDAYEQTSPGNYTFYACLRSVTVPTDGAAMVKFVTTA